MFRSNFSGRTGMVHANCVEGGIMEAEISGGVPQDSIVGPLLWNPTFDAVLRTELPSGAKLLRFADDTMLVTRAKLTQELKAVTKEALSLVEQRITDLGLQISLEKTEAVLFCSRFKYTQPVIKLCGSDVQVSTEMTYLGMVVDRSMLFKGQVKKAAARAADIGNQLARIMPNVGRPREDRRRLLSAVVHSVLLYGAPSTSKRPELSNLQFGFRQQRSTEDAIQEVLRTARAAGQGAVQNRHLCAVVTLDVKNAFNTASWLLIVAALHGSGAPGYLTGILRSYMSEREIQYGAVSSLPVTCGVPQGSVLGPTLWNFFYDGILRLPAPDSVKLMTFADDVAVVAVAHNAELMEQLVNPVLFKVAQWMSANGLTLVPEKSECVILTGKHCVMDVSTTEFVR
ncbi:hypothetical protein QTP88_010221 [Uroleucon formosanum]